MRWQKRIQQPDASLGLQGMSDTYLLCVETRRLGVGKPGAFMNSGAL
jgi:hypothetical protein